MQLNRPTLDTTLGGGVYPQLSELEQHCKEYEAQFSAVDDELYRLFRAHSGHSDPRSVYVKVTFLNRVYMTGLERAASSPDPCERIATLLVSRETEIDSRIDALGAISILSPESLAQVAQIHGWLAREVLGNAGVGQPVSFVSKYLHFHAPVVPIYDSRVCTALGRYIRARFGKQFVATASCLPKLPQQLQDYRWLCARFVPLWEDVYESRPGTSVKQLDYHLWQLGSGS